jgi:hypothetical protein
VVTAKTVAETAAPSAEPSWALEATADSEQITGPQINTSTSAARLFLPALLRPAVKYRISLPSGLRVLVCLLAGSALFVLTLICTILFLTDGGIALPALAFLVVGGFLILVVWAGFVLADQLRESGHSE